MEMLQKALDANHPIIAACFYNLALLHDQQHCYDNAEVLCRRSLIVLEQSGGRSQPAIGKIIGKLSERHIRQDRAADAKGLLSGFREAQGKGLDRR